MKPFSRSTVKHSEGTVGFDRAVKSGGEGLW